MDHGPRGRDRIRVQALFPESPDAVNSLLLPSRWNVASRAFLVGGETVAAASCTMGESWPGGGALLEL